MIKKLKEMMTDGDNTNTQSYGSQHSNGKNHPLIHIHSNYLLLLMMNVLKFLAENCSNIVLKTYNYRTTI